MGKNRDKKLAPKSDKSFYCICDYSHIREGGVCSHCGRKWSTKKLKINKRNSILNEEY
jgi:hypothetical protein